MIGNNLQISIYFSVQSQEVSKCAKNRIWNLKNGRTVTMAPPGGLVWTSRFFVRHSSEYTNKLVHTQRTSVDDIWCWFWKRLLLLHCIKTTLNGTEGQSRCHEVDYFTFSLFNSSILLSFILPSCIRYMKIWHWIRIFSLKPMHTHLIRIISCKLHFFISSQFLTFIFFIPVFTSSFAEGSAKAPFFSSFFLGVCEE